LHGKLSIQMSRSNMDKLEILLSQPTECYSNLKAIMQTELHKACVKGHLELVRLLCEIAKRRSYKLNFNTPSYVAYDEHILEYLLANGANNYRQIFLSHTASIVTGQTDPEKKLHVLGKYTSLSEIKL
jgi:hypothetical protein